ncbi:MAG: sigma-70 family RNA polymerase sigma factor [Acidobacteria bacterium]|nr:sigma-70 family RNA polymerase sigma factor [Acidobacteriota bacterium]
MDRSDENLLQLALQGDGASFGELTGRWQRKIYAFIYRYVGNREEARDLTQDTFTKAFENLERLADPARFSSWIYKIALNECRMRFRKQRHVTPVSLEDSSFREEQSTQLLPLSPEEALVEKEVVRVLKEVMENLPEEQRTVILMKEYQGLKFHEISEILDIPLSTVKSRMYLGLKTLRKLMEIRL